MILNLVLLVGLFSGKKWRKWPYAGAAVFGTVKALFYFFGVWKTHGTAVALVNGAIGGVLFGGMAAGFVYLLRRLDREPPAEATYGTPGAESVSFRWEYIPLSAAILFMVFGEFILAMI